MKPVKFIENHLFLSLLLLVAVIFTGVRFVIGFDGLYGQDAYEYERYSQEIFNSDTVQTGREFSWPVYFSLLGAVLRVIFPFTGFALQIISVFSFALVLYFTARLLKDFFAAEIKTAFLFSVVFVFFSPFVFRSGFVAMPDMMTAALVSGSLYFSFSGYRKKSVKLFFLAVSFAALACLTRYAAIVVVIFPLLLAMFRFRWYHVPAAVVPVIILILPHYLLKNESMGFLQHPFLQNWSFSHMLQNSFSTHEGYSNYFLPNILYGFENWFHPGFIFCGFPLLVFFLFFRKNIHYQLYHYLFLVVPIVLYAFFLSGINRQNDRFLILTFPLVAVVWFPVWNYFIMRLHALSSRWMVYVFAGVINFSLSLYAFRPYYLRNAFEKEATAELLQGNVKLLYVFEADAAVRTRGYANEIVNLWETEVRFFSKGAYVLIDAENIRRQWKNKQPGKNLNLLESTCEIKMVKDFRYNNWKLYRVE